MTIFQSWAMYWAIRFLQFGGYPCFYFRVNPFNDEKVDVVIFAKSEGAYLRHTASPSNE